jgi:poly(3-hydroxybutyrate) depolymerase
MTLLLALACGGADEPDVQPEPPVDDTAQTTDTAVAVFESGCTMEVDRRVCPYETVGLSTGMARRDVHFQRPDSPDVPADGWPVVVLFQGSLFSGETFWEAEPDAPFGGWHQPALVHALLSAGFAVVTPEAQFDGTTFWNTNVWPWSTAWSTSPDHRLMLALFEGLEDGTFGDVDPERLYAAGISSGGYMTSRMAKSYPGRFRALGIQSASWATCGGPLCVLPANLPDDHPPTVFLHGEDDAIVPLWTMEQYADRLDAQGVSTERIVEPDVGHAWLEVAPETLTAWFLAH